MTRSRPPFVLLLLAVVAVVAVALAIWLVGGRVGSEDQGPAVEHGTGGGDGHPPAVLTGRGTATEEPSPATDPPASPDDTPSPAATLQYVLRGRLLGFQPPDGQGARVEVVGLGRSWARPTEPVYATSDDDGRFELDLGPLLAAHPDLSELEVRVEHVAYAEAGTRAEVRAPSTTGGVVHEIEIAVVRAASVEGRVEDEHGRPIEGAHVGLATWNDDRPDAGSVATSTTDAKGRYRLQTRHAGRVLVLAAAERRLPAQRTLEVTVGAALQAPPLVLRPGAVIEGTVRFRDEPLAGAHVEANAPSARHETGVLLSLGRERVLWNVDGLERPRGRAKADDDGRYRLEGLSPAAWIVELDGGGIFTLSGALERGSRRSVDAPARGVDFEIVGALLRFEARVGEQAAATLTWMMNTEGKTSILTTGELGILELVALPGETVRLDYGAGDYEPFSFAFEAPGAGESRTERLALARPKPRPEILVRLTDPSRGGVEHAGFALYPNAERTPFAFHTWDLDAEAGRFRITGALPGRALLVVRAGGSWRGGDAHYLEASREVHVPEEGTLEVEMAVVLGGRLRLRARDPDGSGLGPACVVRNEQGREMDVRFVGRRANSYSVGDALETDVSTNVEPALPAGVYRLTFTTDGYLPKTTEAIIRPGETTTVDVVLTPN